MQNYLNSFDPVQVNDIYLHYDVWLLVNLKPLQSHYENAKQSKGKSISSPLSETVTPSHSRESENNQSGKQVQGQHRSLMTSYWTPQVHTFLGDEAMCWKSTNAITTENFD